MKLTAIFEEWHLGDGNYPPLNKGQLVNLSFEIQPTKIEITDGGLHTEEFSHIEEAPYQFCGRVLKVYDDLGDVIVDRKRSPPASSSPMAIVQLSTTNVAPDC